jgi:hypothetical protein
MGPLTEKFEKYLVRKNAIYRNMLNEDQLEDMLNQQAAILKKIADAEDVYDSLVSISPIRSDY